MFNEGIKEADASSKAREQSESAGGKNICEGVGGAGDFQRRSQRGWGSWLDGQGSGTRRRRRSRCDYRVFLDRRRRRRHTGDTTSVGGGRAVWSARDRCGAARWSGTLGNAPGSGGGGEGLVIYCDKHPTHDRAGIEAPGSGNPRWALACLEWNPETCFRGAARLGVPNRRWYYVKRRTVQHIS